MRLGDTLLLHALSYVQALASNAEAHESEIKHIANRNAVNK